MIDNTIKVPSPWIPVKVSENENGIFVKVWGREYTFGKEMFPVSIKSCEKEMLAKPIKLTAKDNGVEVVWQDREIWVQEHDDRHAVIMAAMQSRFAVISAVITIEFDGYISYDLKLSTRADEVRSGFDEKPDMAERIVDSLILEIPFKKEFARFCHRSKFGTDTDPYYSGKATGESTGFFPHIWYGNDDMGFGIYFDSDENINPANENRVWEVKTDGEMYMLRCHLLDAQPKLWQYEKNKRHNFNRGIAYTPLSYHFGFQATPVKKTDEKLLLKEHIVHVDCFNHINADYLEYFISPVKEYGNKNILDRLKEKGVTTLTLHQKWNKIQGYWDLGEKDGEKIHILIEEAHKRGIKIVFYFCNTISTLRPVTDKYLELNTVRDRDCLPLISFYRTPPQRTYRTCAAGPDLFRDFTEGMVKFIKEYDPDGVYIDSANIPWACTNGNHGCGYTDENGVRRPTYPVSLMRRAFMNIYEEIHEKLGKSIQVHPWSAFIPSIFAYCDMYWAGEAVALKYKTDTKAIVNALNEEMFRSEFAGKNIGVPCQFLAYNLPDDSWNFRTALSLCAPFGIYPRPIDVHSSLDFMSEIWNILDSFDAKDCIFKPFYSGNSGAVSDCGDIRISAYENDDTFVLVISNPTTEDVTGATVKSEYPAKRELMHGKNVEGRCFAVDIPAFETLFVECDKNTHNK